MNGNPGVEYPKVAIDLAARDMAQDESVVRVTKGKTRFGRVTTLYYLVDIARFVNRSGNEPVDRRSIVVEVPSGSPDRARTVDRSNWEPLDDD
jgi:hypothetical protein